MHERDCIEAPAYQTDKSKKYRGWFYGYNSMHADKFKCVSVQGNKVKIQSVAQEMQPLQIFSGMAPVAAGPLNGGNTTATSVMLDRAENLLHKNFGQYQFWSARRSMRFAPELRQFANEYRAKHFGSGKNSIFKTEL